jgi:putative ABC transport system ATP-binding protein
VLCFGTDIHALSSGDLSRFLRRRIGFVFQHGNLLSYLNVSENIGFPLALNGVNGTAKQRRVEELLERIGLPRAAGAQPFELSGGELQRVSIARAMAHRPELLLADEPTASLDSATGHDLVELLFGLGKSDGCTVIVSTHDMEILKLADRSVRMRDGRIVEA